MPILGASSLEEAFSLMEAERRRSGKRREFFDHVQSHPIFPVDIAAQNCEELLSTVRPMDEIKMLFHTIMKRPGNYGHTHQMPLVYKIILKYNCLGNYRNNFLLSDHQKERKKTLQVRTSLARTTAPVKE